MVRGILLVLLISVVLPGFVVSGQYGGTPIVGGGIGIITIPSATTISTGFDFGFYYINPDTIAVSVGFAVLERFDISVGYETDDANANEPFLHLRGKYRFAGSNSGDHWAFGIDYTAGLGDNASPGDYLSFYIVNTFFTTAWQFSWGFGYTLESDDNINFMVGVSRKIVTSLYLEADFSNFPNRYYNSSHGNSSRGIGNVALRVHLFDSKLRLTLGLFDAFDENRELGFGAGFKLTM